MKAASAALLLLLALPASGCLGDGGDLGRPCKGPFAFSDVPRDARSDGGRGPRDVGVRVLDASNSSLARVPVVAWWREGDEALLVALRTDGQGLARFDLPAGKDVRFLAGDGAWTHDATLWADDSVTGLLRTAQGPGNGVIELLPNLADGFAAGFWTQVVPTGLPMGVGTPVNWVPARMPWGDAAHIARLEALDLRLAWTNNMDGYVDLAIGVGTPGAWQVWNEDVQAGPGTFQENLHLTREDLDPWSEGDLHAGPAAGTFGVVVDQLMGVTYDLRWTAAFAVDPTLADLCRNGATRLRDVT